jgi:hypothetical protein
MDIETGAATSALVGSVDAVTNPLAEHRQRLHLTADLRLAEGSHWLWLGPPRSDLPRRGEVLAVEQFGARAALLEWIATQRLDAQQCAFSAGQFLDAAEAAALRHASGLGQVFDYRAGRGYYDSQSGAAIAQFLDRAPCRQLLHVNADPAGGFSLMLVAR